MLNVPCILSEKQGQQPWPFMGDKIKPFIIEESIDIHQEIDLIIAREWINKNYSDN